MGTHIFMPTAGLGEPSWAHGVSLPHFASYDRSDGTRRPTAIVGFEAKDVGTLIDAIGDDLKNVSGDPLYWFNAYHAHRYQCRFLDSVIMAPARGSDP